MSDTKQRIDVGEAVKQLVDLADELRRSEKGHLFMDYMPCYSEVRMLLFVPRWPERKLPALEAALDAGDDGTVDAGLLERIIFGIKKKVEDEG